MALFDRVTIVITSNLLLSAILLIWQAYERKYAKYTELKADCANRGWKASCYPFEIGCRGFVATTFQKRWRDSNGFSRKQESGRGMFSVNMVEVCAEE